ncbi:MAG TPA: PilZ domain-containing protein [Thermoanaerobaculia bacterium]
MPEKRFSTRRKRRYLVEWLSDEILCTGFTEDISPTGIFVRSAYIPRVGTVLTLQLQLPTGEKLRVRGRVIRTHRLPQQMRSVLPSGFAIRLSEAPEEYFQLLASLFNLTFAKTG